MLDLLSIGQAAVVLGCREWQLRRLFSRGLYPEPAKLAGDRAIQRHELARIKSALVSAGYLRGDGDDGLGNRTRLAPAESRAS